MAYVKNTWVDQKVQRPKTYNFTNNDDGSTTLIDAFGNVEELGTPVNADNMNHIEDGLANVGMWTYNSTLEYNKDDAVIAIIDDKFVLYKSLQNNNKGNALTNTDYWEEVKLGGSAGLEVCDIGTALYIDETKGLRRRLNGQIVDANTNTQGFIDKLVKIKETNPDYFTDEDTWQSEKTMNVDGCVYKFVLNYSGDNVVSVRLPKYPDYVEVNAGGTLPVVGNGMALGMTDGASTKYTYQAVSGNNLWSRQPGNFTPNQGNVGDTTENVTGYFGDYKFIGIATDPTKSGIETTLKQTKLKLYYFIQIATGVETEVNIKDTLELNNPFTFGMNMYFKGEMENISWLKSSGQQNAKALYPDFYNWVLTNANAGKYGFKLSTASDITDYDFVVNTTDETFRLPLIAERVLIESKIATTDDPSWYNLYSDGWCEQGGRVTVNKDATATATFKKKFKDTQYYANWISCDGVISTGSGTRGADNLTTTSMRIYNGQDCVMLANWTACGYTDISTITSNYNLYYFVGETVKNPNLIDAGRIGENLVNKVEVSNTQWATNACTPDYTAGITVLQNSTTFTAPCAGVFMGSPQLRISDANILVNDVVVYHLSASTASYRSHDIVVLLAGGDVLKSSSQLPASAYSYFYPLKGAK